MTRLLCLFVFLGMTGSQAARAEHRVALLIGNTNYTDAPLSQSAAQVQAVERGLKRHGFRTTTVLNADETTLKSAVTTFVARTPTRGTAVVYFAGYAAAGNWKGQADTFLMPIDGVFRNAREIGHHGVGAAALLQQLAENGGCDTNLLLVEGVLRHPALPQDSPGLIVPAKLPAGTCLAARCQPKQFETPANSVAESMAGRLHNHWGLAEQTFASSVRNACAFRLGQIPDDAVRPNVASEAVAPPDQFPQGTRAGQEWVNARGMVFCWCPAGQFVSGTPTDFEFRFPDEDLEEVEIPRGYWIGKYELTMRENLRGTPRGVLGDSKQHPVTMMQLNDVNRMLKKTLTDAERKAGRLPPDWEYALPTPHEWEYAAKAGTDTPWPFGKRAEQLVLHANFADRSLWETGDEFYEYAHQQWDDGTVWTAPVGQYRPNPWGLHDTLGNVAEWCENQDLRGGSFASSFRYCRPAVRNRWPERSQRNFIGYRVVIRPARAPSTRK